MNDNFQSLTVAPWAFMWSLSFGIFVALKVLSWTSRTVAAPAWKHAAYLFAWPGMDADTFLGNRRVPRSPGLTEWSFALSKLGLGVCLVWLGVPAIAGAHPLIIGWVAMIGIVMTLHCGLFHLLSCLWRSNGVAATPIMNWPIASQGLTEFWGQRWNLAFRDLTHQFLFRPLTRRCGALGAMVIGFLASGLVHDLVISVPAGGGWGLPTGFFLLQAVGILAERSRWGRAIGLGQGPIGWLFCVLVIVVPSPLLFHEPFIAWVILPFLTAIGAAS